MADSFTGALLDAWERGRMESVLRRPLALLAATQPGLEVAESAALPIAQRDVLLIGLRGALFGSHAAGQVRCLECNQRLEVAVDLNALPGADTPMDDAIRTESLGAHDIRFRWPTTLELEQAAAAADPEVAREALLLACVIDVTRANDVLPRDQWPADLAANLAGWLARHEVLYDVTCAACGHRAEFDFDIGAFLWHEVDAWARRRLYEVHVLARSYGWSEADILRLSPVRRQAYLELVQA